MITAPAPAYANADARNAKNVLPPVIQTAHLTMHQMPMPVPNAEPDHYALHGNAFNPDTGQLAKYAELSQCSDSALWVQVCKDEFGWLCQGHGMALPTGTDTMFFIPVHAIPKGKKATYLKIVAMYRPEKANPHRIHFTVSGDHIDYPGDISTKTADLPTVKTLLNSVISTPNTRFMTADLKDFYLGTPLVQYEYMQIPVSVHHPQINYDRIQAATTCAS
jgi:hypothetical protein